MPKLKVKRAVKRRFRITKNGKVVSGHQYHTHHRGKKSKSRLRRQKEPAIMTGKFAKRIKTLLAA